MTRTFASSIPLVILLLSTPALASPTPGGVPLSGRLFSNVYVPTSHAWTRPLQQAMTTAWLQLDPVLGDHSSARVTLTTEWFEASRTDASNRNFTSSVRLGLREGFADFDHEGLQLRMGKEILPWGKSDGINPTDYFAARDYTVLNPDDEVRRIGTQLVRLSWTPRGGLSPVSFTAVWVPVFAQSKLLIPAQTVAAVGQSSLTVETESRNLQNSEFGAKLSVIGSGWDGSLSAFKGWSHVPLFYVRPQGVVQSFQRVRALGGDASISGEKWVGRFEAAYRWLEDERQMLQPDTLDAVLGVERPLGEDFRLQVQGVLRYVPDYVAPEDLRLPAGGQKLARANQLLSGVQFQTRPSATVRLGYEPRDQVLSAEIFVIGNFAGQDYLVRPKIGAQWSDAFRTSLSVDYYGGPEERALGALKDFNALAFEAKYTF